MVGFSSALAFTTILVLVNLVFVSTASDVYDEAQFDNVYHLTEADLVKAESPMPLASKFIGDLTIGSRRGNDYLYHTSIQINNPSSFVNSTTYYYDVQRGRINYLSVINDPGSYAAVCDFPNSLGGSRTYFSIRVIPNSRSSLQLYVAAYV